MTPERYARVKDLFLRACELDEDARGTFLDSECGGDKALRDQVESLLQHDATPTRWNDAATAAGVGQLRPRTPAPRHRFAGKVSAAATELAARLFRGPVERLVAITLTILVVAALAVWMQHGLKESLQTLLAEKLQTILDADVKALELWMENERAAVNSWAEQPDVEHFVDELVRVSRRDGFSREMLVSAPAQSALRAELDPFVADDEINGYAVIDRSGLVLAAEMDANIGLRLNAVGMAELTAVFEGSRQIVKPHPEGAFSSGQHLQFGGPVLGVLAPVAPPDGAEPVAVFGFGVRADGEFTRILEVGRMGETGETYAFDADGRMLSESRFDNDLRKHGVISDNLNSRSVFQVQVRDPGGNLMQGYTPQLEPAARPLTRLAAQAVTARNGPEGTPRHGVILEPYRDYRGVEVIGAWRWLPEYDFGIATEIDRSEAFAPLHYPIQAFWIRTGLLTAAVCLFLLTAIGMAYFKRRSTAPVQLEKYTLLKKIGEGGIGEVYVAQHALLRRPTAIKLLKPEQMTEAGLRRFEREVQLASQLVHPNTIEIFDFGRGSEGVFYYAMEYLWPGVNLAELVALEGPVPEARVVHILKQVCGSLAEAHGKGLVHRDIKPQNIMLCQRGGVADFVKVLDFGLVREVKNAEATAITGATVVAGTPLYLSPERLRHPEGVDPRSDIYALGAVAWFLLSGKKIFDCQSELDLLYHVMQVDPPRASQIAANTVSPELDDLVASCLAKDPDRRPQTIAALLESLAVVSATQNWTAQDAQQSWETLGPRLEFGYTLQSIDTALADEGETVKKQVEG